MGRCRGFLVCVWLLLLNSVAGADVPSLANNNFIRINPTQTTVVLEQPYCAQQQSERVYLYVVQTGGTNATVTIGGKILRTSYRESDGGKLSPYLAAAFPYPGCANFPNFTQSSSAILVQDILDRSIVRVGADFSCLDDPNVSGTCNAPLRNSTAYRFKYVFTDLSDVFKAETKWSPAITTNKAKDPSSIDTWPGRRSGGMIVLTSILSVLVFFILLGLVAAIASGLLGSSSSGMEATRHESRTTHKPQMKAQSAAEPTYATTLPSDERVQYVAHPES
ncbi:uroplakin-3a [Spea bombifrons]|uniref:uroplakin-3a n=1 Tax=Spea bombifrons TaxID=233779 RepID=UPI00234BB331|nr:uroplakin-3a [Spea bombifrons]